MALMEENQILPNISKHPMGTTGMFWSSVDSVWRFFSSVRLALVLLVLIGVGSILGTLIPQVQGTSGLARMVLQESASDVGAALIQFFQMFDIFHSWWYSLLLEMLAINLVVCSLPRFSRLLSHRVQPETPNPSASRIWFPNARPDLSSTTKRKVLFGRKAIVPKTPAGFWRVQTGGWSQSGFLLVHLGVVFVLISGGVAQVSAVEGSMELVPGQVTDTFVVRQGDGTERLMRLPFSVACLDFYLERFSPGLNGVRDFVSIVEVLKNGAVMQKVRLEVNDPLFFDGYAFYQSSYQNLREQDRATLKVRDSKGDRVIQARLGEVVAWGADGTVYQVKEYRERQPDQEEAVRIETTDAEGRRRWFWVFLNHPGFVESNRPGDVGLDLISYKPGYITIFRVKRDPGSPVLWIGTILLLCGLMTVFFARHRQLWFRLSEDGLEVFCWSHRAQEEFVRSLSLRLEGLLEAKHGNTE
jgi:cytochrome c biogenesis protein